MEKRLEPLARGNLSFIGSGLPAQYERMRKFPPLRVSVYAQSFDKKGLDDKTK